MNNNTSTAPVETPPKTLLQKAEAVLAKVYFGLHNVPGKIKDYSPQRIEITVPCQFSTFDFDGLTRLVITAHDECVRASFRNGPPRQIVLMFHDRQREGGMSQRHPTIEQAIKTIRG